MHTVRRLLTVDETSIQGLSDLLIDCVEGGASVNFMHTLSRLKANEFWRRVAEAVADNRRALLVAEDADGIVGSVSLNAANLGDNPGYPTIREDFVKSFKVLRSLPCDVFLGSHTGFYQMTEKYAKLQKGDGPNPYIDPAGYKALIDSSEKAFYARLDELKIAPPK